MRGVHRVGLAAAVAGAALALAAGATAGIEGPCKASIAGEDVGSRGTGSTADAIEVSRDTSVPVSMSSASEIQRLKIQIEFGGFRWTVRDEPATGTSWESSVEVDRYATYGIGLYKVVGSSSGAGLQCSGSALVYVKGNPLSTVAGGVGLGMAIVGALGVAGLALVAARGAGWPLAVGPILGLAGGAGLGVLLQQYGLLYPTQGVAIAWLAGGFAAGLALPALLRLAGGR